MTTYLHMETPATTILSGTEKASVVRMMLEVCEPIEAIPLGKWVAIPPEWPVDNQVELEVYEVEAPMSAAATMDAFLQLTSLMGLTKEYCRRAPSELLHLNVDYWLNQDNKYLGLRIKDTGLIQAIVRKPPVTIGNVTVFDAIVGGRAGAEVDVKLNHSLRATQLRVVFPWDGVLDVVMPYQGWMVGVEMLNSLTGESPLRLRACAYHPVKGWAMIYNHAMSVTLQHKDYKDAEEWVAAATQNALDAAPQEMHDYYHLTDVPIAGEVGVVLRDVFERYKIPVGVREPVTTVVEESTEELTMQTVADALMTVGARAATPIPASQRLFEAAGTLPAATFGRCDSCHRLPSL